MYVKYKNIGLTLLQENEIYRLLNINQDYLDNDLEKIWQIMDWVWDELGCDNNVLDCKKMSEFYRHPVWILNGLFIEQHDLSMQHRNKISDWIVDHNEISQLLDYGGGFGTLAKLIANKKPSLLIDIYEPYPSEYVNEKIKIHKNISFISDFNKKYDLIISTDVLEHVPEPLKLFDEMLNNVKDGGYLIIANCFYPFVKCHLPCTFHLRYTFNFFAKYMGLEVMGQLAGSHARLFRKRRYVSVNWPLIRFMEMNSKMIFLIIESLKPMYHLFFKK